LVSVVSIDQIITAMKFLCDHGCRLGCVAVLVSSCSCFQFKIPSGVSTPARPFSDERKQMFLTRRNPVVVAPLCPISKNLSSCSTKFAATTSSESSSSTSSYSNGESHARNYYPMGITKHYFETMEAQSGKDYRWIKPLAKPVSRVMM
jgi:hypothetical protein